MASDLEWAFGPETLGDFGAASALEWLETDGLGGWASASIVGAHTRRYHGLLVAATRPPAGRLVLLSRLEETLGLEGERFELAANRFPGAIHPQGHRFQAGFRRGLFPVFYYQAGPLTLRKTIASLYGEATRLVLYELLSAPASVELELRPFFACRDYHSLARANAELAREASFEDGVLRYQGYPDQPTVALAVPGGSFHPALDWYYRFEYFRELERGFDGHEDLFTPGVLRVRLAEGERLGVIATTGEPARRDAFALLEAERRRRQALRERLPSRHPLCRALALAADQFLVRRGELRTIVAGYPWFVDWGRDAMISLPGLCLATGRAEEAKPILRAFARAVADGLLPNRFPEEGEEPEYNTVDAGLWFVVAIHRYLKATGDEAFVLGELLPVVREMVAWHQRGTRHGIRQDADGLLLAGEPGVQLTWMDARVGERVVTPRHGKPVEVNALWVNALAILAELEGRAGNADTALAWAEQAARARKRFAEVFWNPERRCLYDVVAEDAKDASLRPNQLLALALPYPLLEGEEARAVLEAVESQLSTPWGLRTLAAGEPGYEPRYQGGPAERDGAYHQGTVWPWLLGPYLTALVRLRGEVGREQGRQLFEALEPALAVATVGTVAEIFDAEPPHRPHGAFAQAWSVAELLRAALDDLGLGARP